jgi:polyphosphate kinase 2 (PPK2 family)
MKNTRKPSPQKEPLSRKDYDKEIKKLQVELCYLQDWVKSTGARVIILFEGRDAAGKAALSRRSPNG